MFKNGIPTINPFRFIKKRVGKKAHKSEIKYRTMIEHSAIGMYIIQDNFFRYVNNKYCEISGFSYEEVVDQIELPDIIYPEDRKIVEQNIAKLLSGKTDSQEFEFRGLRKDQEIIWLRVHGKVMTYQDKPAIYGTCTVISKQKEIEKSMLIDEERLRITLETTQIGVWDWDLEKDIWHASPIYYTMLGYEPIAGPADRDTWLKRVHPDDRAMVQDKINVIRAQKQDHYSYEARMLHADGSYRWHQIIGHIIDKDDHGRIKRIVGIRKDVTDFKQAEDELKKSKRRLRTLIDTIPDLVWLKGPEGIFLQCNKRFEQLFGKAEEEIVGKTDYDFVNKELADFFRQKDQEAKLAGTPSINEEEVIFADGHSEILETIKTPVYENGGKFIGILGIGRDITKRKKIEADLLRNHLLLKDSQRVANIGCWELDIKTEKLFWNEEAYKIYGEKDLNLQPSLELFYQLVHPDDRSIIDQHFPKTKDEKVFTDFECRIIRKDGAVISVLVTGDVEFDEQGEVTRTFGIIQDITKKKKNEQELEKYRQNLERLVQERTEKLESSLEELHCINEELIFQKTELQNIIDELNSTREQLIQAEKMASLGILSSGIAHEINNPLNFIHGGSIALEKYVNSRLKDDLTEISPFLEAINEGVKRASQIVASLGHYSRSDDLPLIECDIHAVIDNCLIMLQNKLKSKINVAKYYTEKKHTLLGNEGKLHQAILNIIVNAEQAIENNGTIDIETDVEDNELLIVIKDSGHGMDPKTIDKIFDPFFTTKATGEGTGLGLYIAYNIIQEHNGKIKYESKVNKGTKAIIRLPIN